MARGGCRANGVFEEIVDMRGVEQGLTRVSDWLGDGGSW
jgi:hypothetical protein